MICEDESHNPEFLDMESHLVRGSINQINQTIDDEALV